MHRLRQLVDGLPVDHERKSMSKLFEEMAQGNRGGRAYVKGERTGYKVTLPESIAVREARSLSIASSSANKASISTASSGTSGGSSGS